MIALDPADGDGPQWLPEIGNPIVLSLAQMVVMVPTR